MGRGRLRVPLLLGVKSHTYMQVIEVCLMGGCLSLSPHSSIALYNVLGYFYGWVSLAYHVFLLLTLVIKLLCILFWDAFYGRLSIA